MYNGSQFQFPIPLIEEMMAQENSFGYWAISCLYSQWASEVTQDVVAEITPVFCIWPGIPWGIQSSLLWCLCGPSPNKCLLVLPQSSQSVRSQDWALVCIPGAHWHDLRNPAAAAWMGPFDGLAEGLSGVGWHRILPFNSTVKSSTRLQRTLFGKITCLSEIPTLYLYAKREHERSGFCSHCSRTRLGTRCSGRYCSNWMMEAKVPKSSRFPLPTCTSPASAP